MICEIIITFYVYLIPSCFRINEKLIIKKEYEKCNIQKEIDFLIDDLYIPFNIGKDIKICFDNNRFKIRSLSSCQTYKLIQSILMRNEIAILNIEHRDLAISTLSKIRLKYFE